MKSVHEAKMEAIGAQKEFLRELKDNIGDIANFVDRSKKKNMIFSLYEFDITTFENAIADYDFETSNLLERYKDNKELSFEEKALLLASEDKGINEQKAYAHISEEFSAGTALLLKFECRNEIVKSSHVLPDDIVKMVRK